MPVAIGVLLAVEIGATIASTVQQKRGADAAARTATQVADYNAKLDRSEAAQVDLDAQANVRAMRRDAETYMSRQTAAYAAAGVRVDSGSPLAVRAITAGRFAMREQQAWADSQAKEQHLESAAQAGIAEGAAKADQYHMQGVAAVMGGVGKVAGLLAGGFASGAFGSMAGTGTMNLSSSLQPGATDLPSVNAGAIA